MVQAANEVVVVKERVVVVNKVTRNVYSAYDRTQFKCTYNICRKLTVWHNALDSASNHSMDRVV